MTTRFFLATTALAAAFAAMGAPSQVRAQANPEDLLVIYPDLAGLQDESCLKRLENFEKKEGAGALGALAATDLGGVAPDGMPPPLAECVLAADAILDAATATSDTETGETAAAQVDDAREPAADAAAAAPAETASEGVPAETTAEAPPAEAVADDQAVEQTDDATPQDPGDTAPSAEDAQEIAASPGSDGGGQASSASAEAAGKVEAPAGGEDVADASDADAPTETAATEASQTSAPAAETAEVTMEAVQEDTAAATEAANETVEAEAAAAETATVESVDTEVVTEETSRSSSEDFQNRRRAASAGAGAASGGTSDDGGIDIGQIALGVLGGIALSEILGANEEVVENTGDRVVVRRGDGDFYVLKDDDALLRRPGTEISTERFADGSTRRTAKRPNGTTVVTIRAANGQVLRRTRTLPDGSTVVLFDDTVEVAPVEVDTLPDDEFGESITLDDRFEEAALRQALANADARAATAGRQFSLAQIRNIRAVRALAPTIELQSVTFDTGSAAIRASEAEELAAIGRVMRDLIAEKPDEVFLIEGHTDATGLATMNLALSDRRAESVALALTEYFDVPPENMVVQGYGESNLKIPTPEAERANRRAAVRRITPLLYGSTTTY